MRLLLNRYYYGHFFAFFNRNKRKITSNLVKAIAWFFKSHIIKNKIKND